MINIKIQKAESDSNNLTEELVDLFSLNNYCEIESHSLKENIDNVFDNQLAKLKALSKQSRLVGFRLYPASYSHKLIEIVRELKEYSLTNGIIAFLIIAQEEFLSNPTWYIDNLYDCNVFLCNGNNFYKLDFLSSVVIQEHYMCYSFFLPKMIRKIGIAHGIDVDINVSLYEFGGAYEFDTLLVGSQRQSKFEKNKYLNVFTKEVMKHTSNSIKLIPFGVPKLDRFINKASNNPKDIIYHISHLSVEEEWVLSSIESTITYILDTFPNHRLIFRPYPDDICHPVLQKISKSYSGNKNFIYSVAPDYVDDYINAAVMITHYEYREHIFTASGGVSIIYSPFNRKKNSQIDARDKTRTIFASTTCELKSGIESALANAINLTKKERISFSESHGYYNVGNSISTLADFLSGKSVSVIDDFPLENSDLISPQVLLRYLSLNNDIPFHKLMLLLISQNYNDHRYFIFLAEACRRAPEFAEEYWQLGLSAIYDFLCKITDSIDCEKFTYMLDMWWKNAGEEFFSRSITNFVSKGGEISGQVEMVLSLMMNRMKVFNPLPFNHFIENVDNGNNLQRGNICLFGSGEISERFIKWNRKQKNNYLIEYVFDSSPERIGKHIGNHLIMPANHIILNSSLENIIICSYYYLLDIYIYLRKECKFKGGVYIWHNNYFSVY